METNFKEIEFRPYNPAVNGMSAPDGELEALGAIAPAELAPVFTLEAGEVMAVHQGRAIIYHDGKLTWALPGEGAHISVDDLVEIAEIPRPHSVTMLGDTLVTTADGAMLYHRFSGIRYTSLPQLPGMPKIEFGMLKQGEMADKCEIIIPASLAPAAPGGSGMSSPHPSVNAASGMNVSEGIDKIFGVFIKNAHDDKRNRGYFTSPFFVRYAVRDRAGNCLCISPPVLMVCGVLPPCMNVEYTFKTETESTMYSHLMGSSYFSLMMRASAMPGQWAEIVKSIDVYVSPQIPAYTPAAGYLCSYATLLREVNFGGTHRGRGKVEIYGTMFEGHYSDDGITFCDHYADQSLGDETVWYVAPNVALASEIVAENRFYRIASFDVDRLAQMQQFTRVDVETTVTALLEKYERLDEQLPVTLCPAALATLNGRLVAAGGYRRAVMPADPAVAAAFSGNAGTQPADTVTVSVYTRDGGALRCLSVTYGSATDFTTGFPRYIYHPDSEASLMTIETGGTVYRLPLTPHPVMPGAFWFGGLAYGSLPEADVGELPDTCNDGELIPCHDRVWLSSPSSSRHFTMEQSIAACNSRVTAVSASVMPPGMNDAGRYPVYVFADDGVWLAEYDSSRSRLCDCHRISSEVCLSARSVAPTDDGIVFASAGALMMAAGAKVKRLMPLTAVCELELPALPGLSEVTDDLSEAVPMLAFDSAASSLVVADSASGKAYICDIRSLSIALWHKRVSALPLTSGRPLLQTADGDVGHMSAASSAIVGSVIVTRPIKLTKAFTPKVLRSVTVWHSGSPDSIVLKVYGANSLASWHLIASSHCHRVEIASRSPWRFVRLAIIPASPSAIYGAQIEWSG